MASNDEVTVKLSALGEELAEGAEIHVCAGRFHFCFRPGETQRVNKSFDWNLILGQEQRDGQPLFVIVEEPPAEGGN